MRPPSSAAPLEAKGEAIVQHVRVGGLTQQQVAGHLDHYQRNSSGGPGQGVGGLEGEAGGGTGFPRGGCS